MQEEASAWFVGALMVVLSVVGIILAAHARDDEMYVFGWSLAGFALVFILYLVNRALSVGEKTHG